MFESSVSKSLVFMEDFIDCVFGFLNKLKFIHKSCYNESNDFTNLWVHQVDICSSFEINKDIYLRKILGSTNKILI